MGAPMRSQPQGLIRLNRSNPLTRGLVAAYVPRSGPRDATGTLSTLVDAVPRLSPLGYVTPPLTTGPYPVVGMFQFVRTDPISAFVLGRFAVSNDANGAPVVSVGQTGGSNGWKFGPMGTSGNIILTFTSVADYSTTVPFPASGSIAFSATPGSSARIFTNGAFRQQLGIGLPNGTFPNSRMAIGQRGDANSDSTSASQVALALYWNRALSDAEQASLAANPWQIFDAGSSSSSYQSATVQSVSPASSGQKLTVANAIQANAGGAVAATARQKLGVAPSSQWNIGANAAAIARQRLSLAPASQSNSGSGTATTARQHLSLSPASQGNAGSSAIAVARQRLSLAPASQSNLSATTVAIGHQRLSIAPASQDNAGSTTVATSHQRLSVAPLSQANSGTSPAVTQSTPAPGRLSLAVASGLQGNAGSRPIVVQRQRLMVAPTTQGNTGSAAAATAHQRLSVLPSSQANAAPSIRVQQRQRLIVVAGIQLNFGSSLRLAAFGYAYKLDLRRVLKLGADRRLLGMGRDNRVLQINGG